MSNERLVCFVRMREWDKKNTGDIRTLCGQKLWLHDVDITELLRRVTCPDCQATKLWQDWYTENVAERMTTGSWG
jgi:hypothetical protein